MSATRVATDVPRPDWTTPADLRAQTEKLWDKGRLLACLAHAGELFPLRLALRGPGSADLSQRFDEVRAWAKQNGQQVSERGRISAAVREAFEAAN